MRRSSLADSPPSAISLADPGPSAAARAPSGDRARRGGVPQAAVDLVESWARVARQTRLPTRRSLLGFLGNEVLVNAVAGTSALVAGDLARRFLEVRGFRNLWGLAVSNDRMLVSAAGYHTVVTLTSYAAGLLMLVGVRQLILRVASEFHALRRERTRDAGGAGRGGPGWEPEPR